MLDSLNDAQKEAVLHNSGPLLIFAGAGSGKTRVITYRIARLIIEGIAQPENILAVTFTRKAAGEMKERVRTLITEAAKANGKPASRLPYVGTFHSFGAQMLRKDGQHIGLSPSFSIYDPDDCEHIIKEILDDMNLDKKQFNPKNIHNSISSAKNELIGPKEYVKFAHGPFDEVVAEIYPKYEESLRSQDAVDFDDLQIIPLRMLTEVPEMREKYQTMYKHILIDEYQDTNEVQYRLVKSLVGKDRNIVVVGDDDQGIYSWRGATIKNILSFERDFPGAKIVKLEKNYRSTRNILMAASSVISRNNERASKELWTDASHGDKISIYEAKNDRDEARYVVEQIKDSQRAGVKLSDIAVLYRINAQSRVIEEELLRYAVPYKLIGGVRFYERREIKDMLAYLRFLANPLDELSFFRVVNIPPRKIGEKTIQKIRTLAKSVTNGKCTAGLLSLICWGELGEVKNWGEYLPGLNITTEDVEAFTKAEDYAEFKKETSRLVSIFGKLYETSLHCNVRSLIDEILEETNYEDWIDDGTPQAESRIENLFELKVVAERYREQGPRDSLLAFLSDVALVEQDENPKGEKNEEDSITLMTLHSAKGLEFDTVFMTGMEEGLFPHSRSFSSPAELEEERRLCYVGITRAKKKLYLSFADSRMTYGGVSDKIPSRFIAEIPSDLVDFEASGNGY